MARRSTWEYQQYRRSCARSVRKLLGWQSWSHHRSSLLRAWGELGGRFHGGYEEVSFVDGLLWIIDVCFSSPSFRRPPRIAKNSKIIFKNWRTRKTYSFQSTSFWTLARSMVFPPAFLENWDGASIYLYRSNSSSVREPGFATTQLNQFASKRTPDEKITYESYWRT